jgi:hypothetical protein
LLREPAEIRKSEDLRSRVFGVDEKADLLGDNKFKATSKGYHGLPLPLLPDIRKAEVDVGTLGRLLALFGVNKRINRVVTLHPGPPAKPILACSIH